MEVFRQIPPDAPLMVVEAVWQYSHHVLHGLWTHRGPILTVANWSGEWPGLVGMLNLNGCLTKAGVPFSTLWSDDFTDDFFLQRPAALAQRRAGGPRHQPRPPPEGSEPARRRRPRSAPNSPRNCAATRPSWASSTKAAWACTTPSSPTSCCTTTGVFKERLSQSALYAEMLRVPDDEAQEVRSWLDLKGHALRHRAGSGH